MIFAIFGTSPYGFERLAKALEKLASGTGERIVAQLGYTSYRPEGVEHFDFLPYPDILRYIDQADLVVTQGGFGAILDCVKAGKPVVAVPRMQEYGELTDRPNGQMELVRELDREGKVTGCFDLEELEEHVRKARSAEKCKRAMSDIPWIVEQFVESQIVSREQ
jgi:UDP-N-acetylglucosamine transferase subunit ALG13